MQPDCEYFNEKARSRRLHLVRVVLLTLLSLGLFLLNIVLSPTDQAESSAFGHQSIRELNEAARQVMRTSGARYTPPATQASPEINLPAEADASLSAMGPIFISMREAGYKRLFAYHPVRMPFTRLTTGLWDDITPAISPDDTRLAFSSNRDGYWDLYLLDLSTGAVTRLTNTPNYDASPSWSPDGHYLVYETYEQDLEVKILPVGSHQPPVSLSAHPAADYEPSWSPGGRQIAFVSTRSGNPDIWLADLDKMDDERFINLSQTQASEESYPAWSPDGKRLAWAAKEDGGHAIYIWDSKNGVNYLGSGDYPVWNPAGSVLLTLLSEPNNDTLTAYLYPEGSGRASGVQLALPPFVLSGSLDGLSWGSVFFPAILPDWIAAAALETPAPLWQPAENRPSDLVVMRHGLAELTDLSAPYPFLHDLVDESFSALRQRVAAEAGWDFLATLENAFVPLTAPLAPGLGEDWLYTGRAFAFSPLPINAGWVVVVQERFGGDIFWRVYLRARFQDGSQGRPLRQQIWDFSARYGGDPMVYEQGGKLLENLPEGYWVDFTDLARAYDWERLPALPIWQSAYYAARFNEFVQSHGKTWHQAMLELYPPQALQTPTAVLPPTLTPTPTPWWKHSP